MLKRLDANLWIADQPLRFLGLELGARMTIVRLSTGALLLHSPIQPSPALVSAVEALGPVAAIIAPNRFHHLFAGAWQAGRPDVPLFAAPGLETKRPDLPIAGPLGDRPEPIWQDDLDQVPIRGLPLLNEVVFFHRATRTLIASDLAFHIGPGHPLATRLFIRITGTEGGLAPTLFERLLVRDRRSARESLRRVLEWPFERVVVAHGTVLESGGRAALARGYAWLLEGG